MGIESGMFRKFLNKGCMPRKFTVIEYLSDPKEWKLKLE
jgi:hypothetical protein